MGHYNYSNKAYLLCEGAVENEILEKAISSVNITVAHFEDNMSSLESLRRRFQTENNISVIKSELFAAIQKEGYPYLFVLDFRVDLGLDDTSDPGGFKFLKNLLISYIVFSMGRGFDRLHLNVLFLFDAGDLPIMEKLANSPNELLSFLHTKNDKVNELINRMRKDRALFGKVFSFYFMEKERLPEECQAKITTIDLAIKAKRKLSDTALEKKLSSVSNISVVPADVFLNSNGTFLQNGEVSDSTPERYSQADDGNLFIDGYWTAATVKEVRGRIIKTINRAIKDRLMTPTSPLVIHLQEKCIIDATIASNLAGLLIQDLSKLKNIRVRVSKFNTPTLQKSEGFNMVREYLSFEK